MPYFTNRGITPLPVGGGAFAGPGDAIAGAVGYWGLRAYSTAAIGANAIRLHPVADGASTTNDANFVTVAGGGLDMTSINAFITLRGACSVVTLYDQVNTRHATQSTAGNQPLFATSVLGSLPAVQFVAASSTRLIIPSGDFSSVGSSQPLTWSAVGKASSAGAHALMGQTILMQVSSSTPDTAIIYASVGAVDRAATEGNFHALQGVFDGASSFINVDGTSGSTGNPGTLAMPGGSDFYIGTDTFNNYHDGYFTEWTLYDIAFNGTNCTDMSSNQHTYWGF